MADATGETSMLIPRMDFQAALGPRYSNQGMKTFDNNIFTPNIGNMDLGLSNAQGLGRPMDVLRDARRGQN